MLEVTALPAKYGDCLWVEYGDKDAPNVILIDGGTGLSEALIEKFQALLRKGGRLELAVVTHIDGDHIAGMIGLLKKNFFGVAVRDFWFNGLRHLPGEAFSEKQGEQLSELILGLGLSWNGDFGGEAISVDTGGQHISLPGGATIDLLSPGNVQLKKLRKGWIDACEAAGLYADSLAESTVKSEKEAFGATTVFDIDELVNDPFIEDDAPANGSSIAFLFTYKGQRILFGADAYPSRLLESLQKLEGQGPYVFDLVKLPHHGSKANVSIEFIQALQSPRYLFSSNGSIFRHPCPEAVARAVRYGRQPELIFNYDTVFTTLWNDPLLIAQYGYRVVYGIDGSVQVNLP